MKNTAENYPKYTSPDHTGGASKTLTPLIAPTLAQTLTPVQCCKTPHQPHEPKPGETEKNEPGEACNCGHAHETEHKHEQASGQKQEAKQDPAQEHGHGCGCSHENSLLQPLDMGNIPAASATRAVYRIRNMDCPMEEAIIRKKLDGMPGITGLEFNLLQRVLTINHELTSLEPVEAALESIDMKPEAIDGGQGDFTLFSVSAMDCPMEENLIKGKLAGMAGVHSLEFNLMQRTLKIGHDPAALPEISAALMSLDLGAKLMDTKSATPADITPPVKWKRLLAAGIAALAAEIVEFSYGDTWVVLVLALTAIALGGLSTYRKGWIALKNLNLNMNALMSFAVTGAMLIGQWPEAAMVMVLFTLAEVIEAKSLDRARNAIQKLLSMAPERATVQLPDGSWSDVNINQVAVGSKVRVKPGERIALDGKIVDGNSTVNQAPITGESLPVEKNIGDTVFAGTINESGSFEYLVTAAAANSTLARIIHAVESAQGNRAPIQRFIDNFAKVYTPTIFLIALLVGVIPPLFMGGEWFAWTYKALVLLVIACPCALVISTPVSIVSGLAAATRHGILIKGGTFLEQGRKLTWIALDKTGTVTHGKPRQTDFMQLGTLGKDEVVTLAASLAARSDHPVSKAIASAAHQDKSTLLEVSDFAAIPGQGTRGVINGELWHMGNHRMVEELNLCGPELEKKIFALEEQGKSVVLLIGAKGVQGLFAVADTLKESSVEAIAELKKLGIKTMMLTGDNEHTAKVISGQVGVDAVQGNLLPEDKLAAVEKLAQSGKVGMVGDGINDAPALARADIGFAMGAAGTDTAIETADVALMDDDLRKIPVFINLSKATYNILVQNITVALGIKGIFFALTFFGQTTMWMAVFADMGTSLLVVGNGLRLLRK